MTSQYSIEDFVSALRQVAEVFADAVANAMQYARDNKPPGEGLPASPQLPSGLDTAPSPRESLPPSNQSAPPSLPPPGNVGADFLHPVIYQFLKDAPPLPGYAGLDTKEEKQNYENLIKRFLRKTKKEGLIDELLERKKYKKPTTVRREAKFKRLLTLKRLREEENLDLSVDK